MDKRKSTIPDEDNIQLKFQEILKGRFETQEKLKTQLEEKLKTDPGKVLSRNKLVGSLSKDDIGDNDSKLAEVFNRIGNAEREIDSDKHEVKRIEQLLTSKLDGNQSLVIGVIVVAIFTVTGLVWQSFWMYPGISKDFVTKTEEQNTRIQKQDIQIDILKGDILELKAKLEIEIEKRISLELTLKK